jgi:hypothetical protein
MANKRPASWKPKAERAREANSIRNKTLTFLFGGPALALTALMWINSPEAKSLEPNRQPKSPTPTDIVAPDIAQSFSENSASETEEKQYIEEAVKSAPAQEKVPEIATTTEVETPIQKFAAANGKNTADRFADYHVPPNIDTILREITDGDAVSYEMMVAILGSESGFKNVNSHTGARSYGQWTGAPFLERLRRDYKVLPQYAQDRITQINATPMKGTKEQKAEIRDQKRNALLKLAYDPRIALTCSREYIREMVTEADRLFRQGLQEKIAFISVKYPAAQTVERLKVLHAELERRLTIADAKLVYFAGASGAAKVMLANADINTHHQGILGYIPAHVVKNNKNVFNREGGGTLTAPELIGYMAKRVGNAEIPRNLNQRGTQARLALNTMEFTAQ